jgi:hypothetical protein
MINAKDVNLPNARQAFGKLLDAIPRGKRGAMFQEMCMVEGTINYLAALLNNIRGYFLQHAGGEDSPFVKKIDEVIPRPAPEAPAEQAKPDK